MDALFDGLPDGEPPTSPTIDADFSRKRLLLHAPDAETNTLTFIGKLPPIRDGSEFEDLILVNALGSGAKSVIIEAVRTQLRAGYESGIAEFSREHRILLMTGTVETSKISDAENLIRKAYSDFRANGITSELSALKVPYEDGLKESAKDTGTVALRALLSKIDGRDARRILARQKELDAVTVDTLKDRLKSAFPAADELMVLVSSPDADALENACVITDPQQAVMCD